MQRYRIKAAYSFSFFAIATTSLLLLTSGVAQAQCNFFTGFADNKDGTVTDTRNGLLWKRCAEGFDFSNGVCTGEGTEANWESATSMAQQSRFLDQSDWRLPTKEEFEAVLGTFDECNNNQAGEYAASKAIAHEEASKFWSASPIGGNSGGAWGVDFGNGFVGGYDRTNPYYVRLVRAGQVLGGAAALEFVNEITEKENRLRSEITEKENRFRAEVPNRLKAMSKDEVCLAYGNALRKGEIDGVALPDIAKLVKKELARRKLKLDDSLARKGQIKIGISECQLYASWGMSKDQNRTVGDWGVHIQNVYGSGTYVYTENGRVTSWQD